MSLNSARKRKSISSSSRIALEHVSGHSATNPTCHSVSSSGDIAYTAGNTIVIYNTKTNAQSFITGRNGHIISCLAYSPDGALIAAGEAGSNAAICIYDVASGECRYVHSQLLQGHIQSMRWHPTLPLIGAVGQHVDSSQPVDSVTISPQASVLVVFDYRSDKSANVLRSHTDSCNGFDISSDGSYFVTCGDKLLMFHYLLQSDRGSDQPSDFVVDDRKLSIERVEAKLGVHKAAVFSSLACGSSASANYVFTLTREGVLCAFTQKERRKAPPNSAPARSYAWDVEKWVDLRLKLGYSISLAHVGSSGVLALAGAEGKIRLFEPLQLDHLATMPKPPSVAYTNADPNSKVQAPIPHTLAVSIARDQSKVFAFYSDRSMVVWDTRDLKKAIKPLRTLTAHSGCIWDMMEIADATEEPGMHFGNAAPRVSRNSNWNSVVPYQSVVTYAADSVLRVWHFDNAQASKARAARGEPESRFVDTPCIASALLTESTGNSHLSWPTSPGAKFLVSINSEIAALVDKKGMVSVFSLVSMSVLHSFKQTLGQSADVKCIDYSHETRSLIAGCKDGSMIHYDLHDFEKPVITSISHPTRLTSAVVALKFTSSGARLVSITADNKLFVDVRNTNDWSALPNCGFVSHSHATIKSGTCLDLVIHPTDKFAAICNNDGVVRVFDLFTGRETRNYHSSGAASQSGARIEAQRACLDATGSLLAVANSDRSINIIDWFSGALVASLSGHGASIQSLSFVGGCARLVSCSTDGCVFVHRLDARFNQMLHALTQQNSNQVSSPANYQLRSARRPATNGNGPQTARRSRRSAGAYFDDDDDDISQTESSISKSGHEEEKEIPMMRPMESTPMSPVLSVRPVGVPALKLPTDPSAPSTEEKSFRPSTVPDWAKTRNPGASAETETSSDSSSVSSPPSIPAHSRWSERAGPGYRIASDLGDSGVSISPIKMTPLMTAQNTTNALPQLPVGSTPSKVTTSEQSDVESHVIEPVSAPVRKPLPEHQNGADSTSTAQATDVQVIDLDATSESVVNEARSSPRRNASPPIAVDLMRNKSSSPRAPSRPVSPAVNAPLIPPTVAQPSLPKVPETEGISSSLPPAVPARPSRLSSSRSHSRTTSPERSVSLASAVSPKPAHASLPSSPAPQQAENSPTDSTKIPVEPLLASVSQSTAQPSSLSVPVCQLALQRLQHHFTHTLNLFDQLRLYNSTTDPSDPKSAEVSQLVTTYERDLSDLSERLSHALSSSTSVKPALTHSTSVVVGSVALKPDIHSRSVSLSADTHLNPMSLDSLGLDASLNATGALVTQSLDRYSELLVDLVMKKLERTQKPEV